MSLLIVAGGLVSAILVLLLSAWLESRLSANREARIRQIEVDHEYRMKQLEQEQRWLEEAENDR